MIGARAIGKSALNLEQAPPALSSKGAEGGCQY
jgi:hypothetical protein